MLFFFFCSFENVGHSSSPPTICLPLIFLVRQHRCDHYSTDSETKRGTRQNTKAAHAAAKTTWDTSRDEDNDEDPPEDRPTCPPADRSERWQAEWCPPAKGVRTPRVSKGIGFFLEIYGFFFCEFHHTTTNPLDEGSDLVQGYQRERMRGWSQWRGCPRVEGADFFWI